MKWILIFMIVNLGVFLGLQHIFNTILNLLLVNIFAACTIATAYFTGYLYAEEELT